MEKSTNRKGFGISTTPGTMATPVLFCPSSEAAAALGGKQKKQQEKNNNTDNPDFYRLKQRCNELQRALNSETWT